MTRVYYYEKPPPPWPCYEALNSKVPGRPIQPGYVPSSLENICSNVLGDNLPDAWFWNLEDVGNWLAELGLEKYSVIFKKNMIAGNVLPLLDINMLQSMNIVYFNDAMTILHQICNLFKIRPNKKFRGPIEQPVVDPRRRYLWYRRDFELSNPRLEEKAPLTITEWMYENGYLHMHYHRWITPKYFNKLPFLIGHICPFPVEKLFD